MASGIKPSAANIIAEFCGPIVREKANEPDTLAMAREVITTLAISKIRSEKSVESGRFEFDILSIDGNGGNPYLSDGFEGFEHDNRHLKLRGIWLSFKIDF